jgi:4-amino-4-deoxy-L-arabinose transferase-like glycosyltransferase
MRWLRRRPIWIVVLSGLSARVAWWAYAEPAPVSDFEYYRRLAEGLLEHGQLGFPNPIAWRPPGYPAFLALLMLIHKSVAWLSLANALISSVLPYLVFRLTLQLTANQRTGLIAAVFCALNPTFVLFSPVLGSEHLFAPLMLSSLVALCGQRGPATTSRFGPGLAGVLFGAAVLTRPDALFHFPVFALVCWFGSRRTREVLAFSLAVLVTLLPWYIRNETVVGSGAGLSTQGGISFYYAHNSVHSWHPLKGTPLDAVSEVERNKIGYQLGLEYIANASLADLASDLVRATGRLFSVSENYGEYWTTRAPGNNPDDLSDNELGRRPMFNGVVRWYNVLLFITAAASLLVARRLSWPTRTIVYGIVITTWLGYAVVFDAISRYRYFCDIALSVMAALTVQRGIERRGEEQVPGGRAKGFPSSASGR